MSQVSRRTIDRGLTGRSDPFLDARAVTGRLGTTLAVGGKTMAADAEARSSPTPARSDPQMKSARPSKTLRANKRKAKLKAKHRSPASPSDCLGPVRKLRIDF